MKRRATKAVVLAVVLCSLVVYMPLVHAAPVQTGTGLTDEGILEIYTEVRELIANYHTKDISNQRLFEGMMRGLLDALDDPYSQYLNQVQYDSLFSTLEGEYSGIGVTIDLVDKRIVVVSTFPGSPAEVSGVKPGDVIVEAEGTDLRNKVPGDASAILRGDAGTAVVLTVDRPSTGETLTFTLIREVIRQQSLSLTELGNGMYRVGISQFTTDTAVQFPVLMKYMRERGLKGLILDLRNNPGGLLDSALSIASELVPKGPIVELRRKEMKQMIENLVDTVPVPIVVLTNRGSASASEILAGAIKDRGVGVLVGERTFGKAVVQSILPLGEGLGGIRITTADYYTPSGYLLADVGLVPDFSVAQTQVAEPDTLTHERPLRRGTVGLDVLGLQETLRFLGYEKIVLDGVLGSDTDEALVLVARSANTTYSGFTTPELISGINRLVEERMRSFPDEVLMEGTRILSAKLATGYWPSAGEVAGW